MTDHFKTQLNAGFKTIRAQGYFARQSWRCCQSCGCNAIPKDKDSHYAFFHRQDAERLAEAMYGDRRGVVKVEDVGVYLSWSGDGEVIARAFREAGCTVEWSGSEHERIWVCATPTPEQVEAEDRARLEALVA